LVHTWRVAHMTGWSPFSVKENGELSRSLAR